MKQASKINFFIFFFSFLHYYIFFLESRRRSKRREKERIMNEAEACLVKNVIYDLVKTL